MMTPATPNRFQAVLETVRAGDDQARCDAEAARARRRDHLYRWWYGTPTHKPAPALPWCAAERAAERERAA